MLKGPGENTAITVLIQIVVTATITFSLAGVRLLIEGSSYSINFGMIPPGAIHKSSNVKSLIYECCTSNCQDMIEKAAKQRTSSATLLSWTNDHSPLVIVATPTKLCLCMHVATIRGRLLSLLPKLQVQLLFEGGYYSGCGFYSRIHVINQSKPVRTSNRTKALKCRSARTINLSTHQLGW